MCIFSNVTQIMPKHFNWLLCSFASLAIISPAWSAPGSTIDSALQEKNYEQVLTLTNKVLKDDPTNPDARLKQSVAQMELGQTSLAEAQLNSLRRDFPANPSPLLNLAAIKARQGKLIEARDLLDRSLQLDPSLVSAKESLGNVYLGLAWQNFQPLASLQPAQAQRWQNQTHGIEVLLNGTALAPTPVVAQQTTPVSTEALPVNASDAAITAAVERWRAAWASADLTQYLNCYSTDFTPENRSKTSWLNSKKVLLRQARTIQIDITVLSITTNNEFTTVFLQQNYRSHQHQDSGVKELKLVRVADDWKIISEKFTPKISSTN